MSTNTRDAKRKRISTASLSGSTGEVTASTSGAGSGSGRKRAPKLTQKFLANCGRLEDVGAHPADWIYRSNKDCQLCKFETPGLQITAKLQCRKCLVNLCGHCWNKFHGL
mmetsp:Transcript_22496/g.37604  ORF Transcript_22496/g.37604 Transcript_22496/m.37604 type:complete len:110 (+) Transcript_22496:190-519(+)